MQIPEPPGTKLFPLLPLLRAPQREEHQDGVRRILELAEQWLHALALPQARQGVPFGLSEREYATAQLAAKGLANQEIGDQLHVSVNTAKTHLKAVYKKCGVQKRPDLRKRFVHDHITQNGG